MTAPETPIDPLPGSRPTRHLLRIFVTGLLAALPLAATVAIFWWAANLLIRWLGPDSLVGGALAALGLGVTGSEVAGYAIGVALVAGGGRAATRSGPHGRRGARAHPTGAQRL
jgi:hypothetical protein